MATHGGAAPERGGFGLGRRVEAARVASNFYAVVFLSTVARGRGPGRMARRRRFLSRAPRALAEDPCDGTVDLVHGWDHDRVRVVETTRLALACGRLLRESGRALDAIPALRLAESLAT